MSNSDTPQKIIIRTPNWLGDLMMSTAFINAVLERYPSAAVDLIVRAGFESIPLPHRGKVIPFDKKKESAGQFGKTLRSKKYDLIYVLPPSFSSAWMAYQAQIPTRIGYRSELRRFLLSPAKTYIQKHRSQHLVTEYLQLLNGLDHPQVFPSLRITDGWIAAVLSDGFSALDKSAVVMAPGAMYGPAKQWPVSHYRELASRLKESGIPTIVIGTKDDIPAGAEISADNSLVTDLCGKTSLREMIAVMANSALLISNDSGTMHVMAALRKPQIAIFGSTSTTWTSPVNRDAEIVTLKFDCAPCYKRVCKYGHTNCLQEISAGHIAEMVKHQLAAAPK